MIKISEHRFFQIGLGVSFLLHAVIVIGFVQSKDQLQQLEKQVDQVKKRDMKFETEKKKKYKPIEVKKIPPQAKIAEKPKALERKQESALPLVKDRSPMPQHFQSSLERKPAKLKGMKVSRQVAVPMLQSGKINSPAYVTYYQIVRDRIRQKAYNNYVQYRSGDVYMTFVLLANGELKQIQIVPGKSTPDPYLHEVGLESVHQASPFPSFPEELKYPELTFNIVITFQFDEE